ncbi:MAG: hypothetical protein U0031_02835 [Thermomicrobiales bacterium]
MPEEPAARYRVQEELAQVGKTEAGSESQTIIGQSGFDAEAREGKGERGKGGKGGRE